MRAATSPVISLGENRSAACYINQCGGLHSNTLLPLLRCRDHGRRNADTLKKLQETEKLLKERTEAAYVNLDVSNEEREKGNQVRQGSTH